MYGLFSAFVAIPLTYIFMIIYKGMIVPSKRRKLINKARESGKIVTAKLVKRLTVSSEYRGMDLYLYNYQYGGKDYKYRDWFMPVPPDELTLYILNNPKKATIENKFGNPGFLKVMFYYFIIICLNTLFLLIIK